MSKHFYAAIKVRVEKGAKAMPVVHNLGAAASKEEADKIFFKALNDFTAQNTDNVWKCLENDSTHLFRCFFYKNKETGEKVIFKLYPLMDIWED